MKRYSISINDTSRSYPRTLEQAFGPYQRLSEIVPMDDDNRNPPTIWPFLLICALAVALALLSGCTGADAGEQPQQAYLVAQQQRLASAASKACGPGMTAIWQDSTQMQCMREVRP